MCELQSAPLSGDAGDDIGAVVGAYVVADVGNIVGDGV
jgi:hypothetical protein